MITFLNKQKTIRLVVSDINLSSKLSTPPNLQDVEGAVSQLFILWKRWFGLSGVKQVTEAANCLWVRSTSVISTLSFKFKMSKFSPGRYFTQPYYLGSQGNMEVKLKEAKDESRSLPLCHSGASTACESSLLVRNHPLGLGWKESLEKVTMMIMSLLLEAYICLGSVRCQKRNVVSVGLLTKILLYFNLKQRLKYYLWNTKS